MTDVIDTTATELEASPPTSAVSRPETAALVPVTEPQFPAAQQRVTMLRTYIDLAGRLAATEFVPKGLRNKPPAVLAAMLTGLELGIGPMQSLAHIHVVDGKPTQSAELMRALVLKAGHRFAIRSKSNRAVKVWGKRADTGDELEIEWTIEDAVQAGLCRLENGKAKARSDRNQPLPWESYTRMMLMARATSELCRDLFPDVLGGVSYTPEELGAEVAVSTDGTIDVDSEEAVAIGSSSSAAGMDPSAAWDTVSAMRPREVMEALKARGANAVGKAEELKGRLVEILSAEAPAQEAATTPQEPATPSEPVKVDDEAPGPDGRQYAAAGGVGSGEEPELELCSNGCGADLGETGGVFGSDGKGTCPDCYYPLEKATPADVEGGEPFEEPKSP